MPVAPTSARIAPRLLCLEDAAFYVSVGASTFQKMVDAGTMPAPKRIHGRRIGWDRQALDAAIDDLPSDGSAGVADSWGS